MRTQQEDWEEQRRWREDRDRRFAERIELQRQLHEADPEHHSLMVPVDDPEWATEAYCAGWRDEDEEADDDE